MMHRRPAGFIQPCLPSRAVRLPSGRLWVHEIKHDGYRLMVRRDGPRVRCFTKNGYDWASRFPAIVDAALRLKAQSFMLDGEAVTPAPMAWRTSVRCAVGRAIRQCCTPSTCSCTKTTICATWR